MNASRAPPISWTMTVILCNADENGNWCRIASPSTGTWLTDGEWRGAYCKASSYWDLTAPPSALVLPKQRGNITHFSHQQFKTHQWASQHCGSVQFSPGVDAVGRLTCKAYLANCICRLNHRGVCRHSLDVEITPRNSHFLFQKWDISLERFAYSSYTKTKFAPFSCGDPPQPPQCIHGPLPAVGLVKSDGFYSRKTNRKAQGSGNAGTWRTCTTELFMQFIWRSLLELLHKGSFSASEELSLKLLSMNCRAYFVRSRYLTVFLSLESLLILLFPVCLKWPEQGIFLPYAWLLSRNNCNNDSKL